MTSSLTIIGATGRTGRLVVAEAARRGHRITALSRRPDAMPHEPGVERVVPGDGRDATAVREAVAGADAVVAIVSAGSRNGPHHASEVAAVLTRAMAERGVPRLVFTSAYPVVATEPRLAIALLRRVFADAYADMRAMERTVAASGLDWRILRLNRLTDGPPRGGTRISRELIDRPAALTRADAATAILDVVEDDALARTAVNAAGAARGGLA